MRIGVTGRFDALDAAAQTRKRVGACGAHAPLLLEISPSTVLSDEPAAGSFVHDMF
jgi:hypothetical protein